MGFNHQFSIHKKLEVNWKFQKGKHDGDLPISVLEIDKSAVSGCAAGATENGAFEFLISKLQWSRQFRNARLSLPKRKLMHSNG